MRCDIVEYVHLYRWKELSDACNAALERWRKRHKGEPASDWDEKFYMTGDYDYASIDYKPDYAAAGFSSMVNFYLPKHGDLDSIVYTWQAYADSVAAHSDWHPFSYLNNSYHRDTDMNNIIDCATCLLLSPGAVQIFYGDESRRGLSDARLNVDSDQAFRSDMNWETADSAVHEHFKRLGKIRQSHRVIGSGRQINIDNHTCARTDGKETVVICVVPNPERGINVGGQFADGTVVTELFTGEKATVKDGRVKFASHRNNVAIIAVAE